MTTAASTTDQDTATTSQVRQLLEAARLDRKDAEDATRADEGALELALQRVALGDSKQARAELKQARDRLAASLEAQTIAEARVRALEAGLERAQQTERSSIRDKWRRVEDAQRELVAADRDMTAQLLERFVADLDAEEQRLAGRKAVVDRLAQDAAMEGAGMVSPARLLSDDYRPHRQLRELATYLADMRR